MQLESSLDLKRHDMSESMVTTYKFLMIAPRFLPSFRSPNPQHDRKTESLQISDKNASTPVILFILCRNEGGTSSKPDSPLA